MNIEGNTQIKEVKDTIVILRELSADEKVRELVYYREKRPHDEVSALGYARREGETKGKNDAVNEIAENLRAMGMPEEQIRKATNIK